MDHRHVGMVGVAESSARTLSPHKGPVVRKIENTILDLSRLASGSLLAPPAPGRRSHGGITRVASLVVGRWTIIESRRPEHQHLGFALAAWAARVVAGV